MPDQIQLRHAAAVMAPAGPAAMPAETAAAPWPAQILDACRQEGSAQPGLVCGLYAAGVLAVQVVQQPANDPAYIAAQLGTATQFHRADLYSAVGLLAHNTLSGRDFFKLLPGQKLTLLYADGHVARFHVSQIGDYQRLQLANLRSDFISLATNQRVTADQVFAQYYEQPHRLTLQTCIQRGDVADWGVHFVVADPD